jgi:hypothetical protein
MSGPVIWYLIKFFTEEQHADQFMAGELYLNTLAYFKQVEAEDSDGRMDATEGVAMWWQPHDLVMKLNVPGIGDIEITKADLAGPVSMAFDYHNNLHLFCLYALHTTGFECVDGKIDFAPEQADELHRQLHIDERCMKFGNFAVITPAVPFLAQLRDALNAQRYKACWKLVEYYDEETFHGEIPPKEIPFRKQKRFSYQREFRLCVYPRTQEEAANSDPITVSIGDISHICGKVEAARVPSIFELKTEPAPPPALEAAP